MCATTSTELFSNRFPISQSNNICLGHWKFLIFNFHLIKSNQYTSSSYYEWITTAFQWDGDFDLLFYWSSENIIAIVIIKIRIIRCYHVIFELFSDRCLIIRTHWSPLWVKFLHKCNPTQLELCALNTLASNIVFDPISQFCMHINQRNSLDVCRKNCAAIPTKFSLIPNPFFFLKPKARKCPGHCN